MTKARMYQIHRYIAMRNHHTMLLEAAIERNDQQAIAHETKVLETLKSTLN